jgi:hypothetical protein
MPEKMPTKTEQNQTPPAIDFDNNLSLCFFKICRALSLKYYSNNVILICPAASKKIELIFLLPEVVLRYCSPAISSRKHCEGVAISEKVYDCDLIAG